MFAGSACMWFCQQSVRSVENKTLRNSVVFHRVGFGRSYSQEPGCCSGIYRSDAGESISSRLRGDESCTFTLSHALSFSSFRFLSSALPRTLAPKTARSLLLFWHIFRCDISSTKSTQIIACVLWPGQASLQTTSRILRSCQLLILRRVESSMWRCQPGHTDPQHFLLFIFHQFISTPSQRRSFFCCFF